MYFESFADILSMAGHGVFVWSAYGISVAIIAVLMVQPIAAYRQQLKSLARRAPMNDEPQ